MDEGPRGAEHRCVPDLDKPIAERPDRVLREPACRPVIARIGTDEAEKALLREPAVEGMEVFSFGQAEKLAHPLRAEVPGVVRIEEVPETLHPAEPAAEVDSAVRGPVGEDLVDAPVRIPLFA